MTSVDPNADRRWPRWVFGVGEEPDPRFTFANERTFLAWVRTGLGFLAAGVAVAAVAQLNAALSIEARLASVVLIVCGLITGIGAIIRWARAERALRLHRPLPSSPMVPVVTLGLVIIAVIGLVVLLLGR